VNDRESPLFTVRSGTQRARSLATAHAADEANLREESAECEVIDGQPCICDDVLVWYSVVRQGTLEP